MAQTHSKIKSVLLLAILIRIILVLISVWHPDLPNHIDWGNRFLSYGSRTFYESSIWSVSWPNQPFGSILLFAFMALIKNWLFTSIMFVNNHIPAFPSFIIPILELKLHAWLVKLPFILADLGIGYLIYKIVLEFKPARPADGSKLAITAASFFLFNPVMIYNSTIWGQTDSLINLLALSGIYLTFKKKYFPGIILFLSTFLFKLSLIIYLPIFGLLFLKQIKDWKKFVLPVLIFTSFIFLLAIPFTFGDKNPFQWLWYMYTNRVLVRQGSMLNGNAFNLWSLIFSIDISKSEFGQFFGLSYQFIGRILYIIFLIPIWIKFLRSPNTLTNLFFALTLSALGSFIFLTNMHERYLYPIFPLITTLIFLPNSFIKKFDLIILSIIHFLNLYNLWFYPLIPFIRTALISFNFLLCRVLSVILIVFCLNYLVRYLKSEIK
jgi:Gpi18-like mannosyltransferase